MAGAQFVDAQSVVPRTALVSIIKGNSLIMACKDGGNYPNTLEVSLRQCNVPAHQCSEIEASIMRC